MIAKQDLFEARRFDGGDNDIIDILMRRSADWGATSEVWKRLLCLNHPNPDKPEK